MNTEEAELLRLRNEMFEGWIGLWYEWQQGGNLEEWAEQYVRPYMVKLEYVLHGPRGHPDLDPEYQQQLLEEE